MTSYGGDLHLVRLTPEFSQLCAVLGWRIKSTDQWAPFARLVSIHGWKRLLRALERCEPGKRWAQDAERECLQLHRDELDAEREWESRRRAEGVPKHTNGKERAELFSQIRQRVLGEAK